MFRLILDEARPASLNMAVDELLMRRATQSGVPILRFYRWSAPCVTVGYFEEVAKVSRRFGRFPVVRRITGGGAVLHGEDLTFSLVMPLPVRQAGVPAPHFANDVKSSYLKINEAVRVGLRTEYPKMDYADCRTVPSQTSKQKERVCFDAPSCYDLLSAGKKVLGGSQRRTNGVLLHQSTMFLSRPTELLMQRVREGFEQVWKISFEEAPLTQEELTEAAEGERVMKKDASRVYFPEVGSRREAIFLS